MSSCVSIVLKNKKVRTLIKQKFNTNFFIFLYEFKNFNNIQLKKKKNLFFFINNIKSKKKKNYLSIRRILKNKLKFKIKGIFNFFKVFNKYKTPTTKFFLKKKSFKKKKIIKYNNNFNAKYSFFFKNFFKNIYNKNFYLINFNYFLKTKIKKFKKIVKSYFFRNSFFKKTIIMYKILKLSFSSLVYKDSSLLVHIIKKVFERIHYSQHRTYFIF